MHKRTALCTGEDSLVNLLCKFFTAEDKTATRTTESFVCCCCNELTIRNRVRMNACGNKTCDVSHINHKICAYCVGNLTELCKINNSWVCRRTCNNHLRLAFLCNFKNLIIVNSVRFGINTVWNKIEVFT